MECPGSATIKESSLSQARRGRGNPSEKKPHNYKETTAEKLALSSSTEVINPLKLTY